MVLVARFPGHPLLIVPFAQTLATNGATNLHYLIESVNRS